MKTNPEILEMSDIQEIIAVQKRMMRLIRIQAIALLAVSAVLIATMVMT